MVVVLALAPGAAAVDTAPADASTDAVDGLASIDGNVTDDGNETDDGNVTDGADRNETDHGNVTDGADGNETDGVADGNATRGPVEGLPSGVANFTETTSLAGTQTTPASLAGKLRVESAHAGNTSAELVRNSSTNYTLALTVTGHAENVSFYLQKQAVASSQNITNVTAHVDGEPVSFGVTEANDTGWVAFEVDHFSTRNVSFTSDGDTSGFDPVAYDTDGDGSVAGDLDGILQAISDYNSGQLTLEQALQVLSSYNG